MISIVIPAYNEERNLDVLYANVREVLNAASGDNDWELVVVDDGSTDGTWDVLGALSAADVRVRGVRLSRNFGHQSALMAGLAAARGRAVIMMDADLQHPPSLLPQLVRKWREGFQIVHAVRRDPPNLSWFKRTTSRLYYRLFAFMSGVAIEPGSADFCLLDRQVVDEVLKFEEEGLFLRGLVHWVGYATASVPFECGERHAGTSKYNLSKMLTLGWHGVSSFSLVPLRIGIAIGLAVVDVRVPRHGVRDRRLVGRRRRRAGLGVVGRDHVVPVRRAVRVSRRARGVRRADRRRGAAEAAIPGARDDAARARGRRDRRAAAARRLSATRVRVSVCGIRLHASSSSAAPTSS